METITVGGAMSGNWAIGRFLIPSTPRNKRMMEITIAKAGRWSIFANMVAPGARTPATHALFKNCHELVAFWKRQESNKKRTKPNGKSDASQNSQVPQHERHSRFLRFRRVAEPSRNTFSSCDLICDEKTDQTGTI
jgi:hypothetical protein